MKQHTHIGARGPFAHEGDTESCGRVGDPCRPVVPEFPIEFLPGCLTALSDAFLDPDAEARSEMLMHLRRDGMAIADLIDRALPAVARKLGEDWAADRITFAQVTLGTGRLQEAVRALACHDKRRAPAQVDAPLIVLVIPRPEHHVLGAFVLADQWRRMGFRVEMAIDQPAHAIAERIALTRPAMVAITVAGRRTLAAARELIETIRAASCGAVPVVIGGAALAQVGDAAAIAATGADHVARDAATALRLCGLAEAVARCGNITGARPPPCETGDRSGEFDGRR